MAPKPERVVNPYERPHKVYFDGKWPKKTKKVPGYIRNMYGKPRLDWDTPEETPATANAVSKAASMLGSEESRPAMLKPTKDVDSPRLAIRFKFPDQPQSAVAKTAAPTVTSEEKPAMRGTKRPLEPTAPKPDAKRIRKIVLKNEKWDKMMNEPKKAEGGSSPKIKDEEEAEWMCEPNTIMRGWQEQSIRYRETLTDEGGNFLYKW